MKRLIAGLIAASCILPEAAAQTASARASLPTLELSVEAQSAAPNDLSRATMFIEASDIKLATLARKVNNTTATALATAKNVASVKVRSGTTQTVPNYSRAGDRIESWRMHSELVLESRDTPALSELIALLQEAGAGLGQLSFTPSAETRRKAEDMAITEAIAAFKARAELASHALGQRYRIHQLTISTQSSQRPHPLRVMAVKASGTQPAPAEAGESQIMVTVNGSVELLP